VERDTSSSKADDVPCKGKISVMGREGEENKEKEADLTSPVVWDEERNEMLEQRLTLPFLDPSSRDVSPP
jgi:hypothetical protein